MPGIRLHHPTLRNCTIAVECVRGYMNPFACPTCGTVHLYKTVHLNLDNDGDVIVSPGAWEADLKHVPDLPLTVQNTVKKPPKLIIAADGGASQVAREVLAHPFTGRR